METCLLNKYCINVLHLKICSSLCILVGPEENHPILMLVAFKHFENSCFRSDVCLGTESVSAEICLSESACGR